MAQRALIIIDLQNDFCTGGAMAVPGGEQVVPIINGIASRFKRVIATRDWHPPKHVSFASTYNKEPYTSLKIGDRQQELWPNHCVMGTTGAAFHKGFNLKPVNLILHKGNHLEIDSYSAFMENDKKTDTGLQYYLKGLDVDQVFLCGLATDYCVYHSALDAVNMGFDTTVILDATRGVNKPDDSVKNAVSDMNSKGIHIIKHQEI
ncbi:MAG: bifunctional nicotinamidase/pyrazinamidase [Spirochaetes bacterium]|nr:bifunctional nicotinamidase/pyrazinamidase [Spirochaetota bacterium]